MKAGWYPLVIICGGCKQLAPLYDFRYSADGELLFIGKCDDCKAMVHYKVFPSVLAHIALRQDMKNTEPQPVRPPIALPPAPLFSEQDIKDLHDQHILDDTEAA